MMVSGPERQRTGLWRNLAYQYGSGWNRALSYDLPITKKLSEELDVR